MKILIFGPSKSGKTTLARYLLELLHENTIWFNEEVVRSQLGQELATKMLGPKPNEDAYKQAVGMRNLMDRAANDGFNVICDFICPIHEYRDSLFGDVYKIWMNTRVGLWVDDEVSSLNEYNVSDIYNPSRDLVCPGLDPFDNPLQESKFLLNTDKGVFLINVGKSRVFLPEYKHEPTINYDYVVTEQRGDIDAQLIAQKLQEIL